MSASLFQLRFDVLEFPAVTVCNMNQLRSDRVPREIIRLTEEYFNTKRTDLFGGKLRFQEYTGKYIVPVMIDIADVKIFE